MACWARVPPDGNLETEKPFQITITICSSEINFRAECFTSHALDEHLDEAGRPPPPPKPDPIKTLSNPTVDPHPSSELKLDAPPAEVRQVVPMLSEPRQKPGGPRALTPPSDPLIPPERTSEPAPNRKPRFRLIRPKSLVDGSMLPRRNNIKSHQFNPLAVPKFNLPRVNLFRDSLPLQPEAEKSPCRIDAPPASVRSERRPPPPLPAVQRSYSEELPRYSGDAPPEFAPTLRPAIPPRSGSVDAKSIRSLLSPKANPVGGLFSRVRAHTAHKLPLGGVPEGGAPDRRLSKVLDSLTFSHRTAQVQLDHLQRVTPWFPKLSGGGDGAPEVPTGHAPAACPNPPAPAAEGRRGELTRDDAAKRWHLASEMAETEANYLKHLRATLALFRDPLLVPPCPLPADAILGIFGHHERLVALADDVQVALTAVTRPTAWDPAATCIGPIFLSRAHHFRAYLDYIRGYLTAVGLVQRWESASPAFRGILVKGAAANPARQTLKEMLILPVQRLARYALLLQTLRRLTPEAHPDHVSLAEAVERMSGLALEANEARRDEEESAAARAIFFSVDNCPSMLRDAGFRRVFMSEAQELRLRRKLRLFVYPGFIMVTVARRHWRLPAAPGPSPHPTRPRWKFLQLLPLAQLELVEVMDGSRPAEVCLLVHTPLPASPSASTTCVVPPPSIRHYLLQHADRRSHQEFTHILKLHLRTLADPPTFDAGPHATPTPHPPVYTV
ncbi:hypothetical protein L0F63_003590 [Massospora cicadina]|nr:hypothetical protein L0F63_003590 [Massospora cicadina]